MYLCTLKIFILSAKKQEAEKLSQLLEGFEPMEDCEYQLEALEYGDSFEAGIDSAVIIDQNLEVLQGYKRTSSERVVFLTTAAEMEKIDQNTVSAVDDIWIMPSDKVYDKKLLSIYFSKLLNNLKDISDNRRMEICFRTIIDSLPDLVWFKDNDGAHLMVNNEFCDVVKKTKLQVYKQHHNYIWDVPEDDYENGEAVCRQSEDVVVAARKTCQFEETLNTQNGMRQLVTYKSPLIDSNGVIFGTCGMGHDTTDLQNVTKELRFIIDSIPFGVAIVDTSLNVIVINKFFEKFFPNAADCVNKNFKEWSKTLDLEKLGREQDEDLYLFKTNGKEHVMLFHEEPMTDIFGESVGNLQFIRDITMQYNFEQQNLKYANTDFLTGLHNRRSLFDYLTSLGENVKISLIMLDLDKFKSVNDTYGHAAGDEALEITSRTLEECFSDGFIARLGGDEFLVALVGEHTLPQIEQRTQNLLDTLLSNYSHKEEFNALSASAGIAQDQLAVCDIKSIEDLINRSDNALYTAKESGRARYCISR
jgi:diguanylate cyclase (GGDEF)-like protein/PAS domain S-box-containing protein